MAKRHYTIYCDESSKKGKYYSNFYGGAIVRSRDQEAIEAALTAKKDELNLFNELKWTGVTRNYLEKYTEFIKYFFTFIHSGRVKVRIMYTQNMYRPTGLTSEQHDLGYFLLYYQMIKHAFGIQYCNPNALDRVYFSVLLDEVPDTKEKYEYFRAQLSQIPDLYAFRGSNTFIPKQQIAQIDSKRHTILQGLDIILGSMHFRLNDLHKIKPEGARRRGKRTVAKEALFKEISKEIRAGYPNFNIGASTGTANGLQDRWSHNYRHWRFRPGQFEVDTSLTKGKAPQ
ncbi:DUF3800 domain-containing protein [Yoonia sp. R2331]|uniref:DUF3800 domain-containing protein n=1 Tax=Yoonia sp. R2331 TaxID=3237238 RepID=UPI0034E4CC43